MEKFNVYEGIMEGLKEAVAYQQGDCLACKVSVREVPVPKFKAEDVIQTRKALQLTQSALALAIGGSTRTVEAWEAGRNEPSGPASRLLYLLNMDHSLLERLTVR